LTQVTAKHAGREIRPAENAEHVERAESAKPGGNGTGNGAKADQKGERARH
jgi:hypothetical protein